MKITGQSIPPELAAAYANLVSTNVAGVGSARDARTRKKVRQSQAKRKRNPMLEYIKGAVDELIKYKQSGGNWTMPEGFRQDQINKLRNQVFDTDYWVEITQQEEQAYQQVPSWAAYTGARPYSYPDENYLPSRAIYTTGTTTTGNPRYEGSVSGVQYRDTLLRWKRYILTLESTLTKTDNEPIFLVLNMDIDAAATTRPSRAMISTIMQYWLTQDGSSRNSTNAAPTDKPISTLWRYRVPRGEPPYFDLIKGIRQMFYLRTNKAREETGDLGNLVLLLAPMPMMGYRFNNNNTVTTELTNLVVKAFMIKKAVPMMLKNGYYESFAPPHPAYATVTSIDEAIAWMNEQFPEYAPYYWDAYELTCSYDAPYQTMMGNVLPFGYPNSTNNPAKIGQLNRNDTTCGY